MTRLKRAVGYVRVSTDEQAQHGTSISSQIARIRQYCDAEAFELVEVFEEPGLSGKDDGRPKFNRMLALAEADRPPFDIIVVYAFSRFARKLETQAVAIGRLELAGIELRSVTERIEKGANGNLMRSMVGAFNQHVSDQSSMNTIRTMNANAAEGFWNGGPVPFGYRSVTVEKRGNKEKKKLEIVDTEAMIVRKIFELARMGNGAGPMGSRAIAAHLNGQGGRMRTGKFNNSNVSAILAREHYIGHYFDGKANEFKERLPEEEWIRVPCPAIVSEEDFLAVAALRAERAPTKTPPRVVNGTTLLPASVAKCGQPGCGGGLTVITGKGGRYHYYSCNVRTNVRRDACDLQNIPRDLLDGAVLDAVCERVFDRSRITELLGHLLDRAEEKIAGRRSALKVAKAEMTNLDKAIERLVECVEAGVIRPDEIASRMSKHRARKTALKTEIHILQAQIDTARIKIDEKMITNFAARMRRELRSGDNAFRTAYLRLFVSEVVVSAEEIRIIGTTKALEKALIEHDPARPDAVPIFDREWCRLQDSNL